MSREQSIKRKLIEEPEDEHKEMSIIKDKQQYSIRIPRDFATTLQNSLGDLEKLKFRFTLTIPPLKSQDKPKLKGELINEP